MKRLLLLVLLSSSNLFAQLSDAQYLSAYQNAVSLFKDKKYAEAFAKFTPLTNKNYKNDVAPYAYLYSALSAEKSGNKYQSKVIFKNLFQFYPEWDKIDEARILYAKVNFEDGLYEEGMKVLDQLTDKKFNTVKNGLMEEYLKNIKTVTSLKNLYQKYPNYKPLAKVLVNKIQSNRYNSKEDLELSDMLTNRFNLIEDSGNSKTKNNKKNNKTQINFAVMLPFELSSGNLPTVSQRYVYDMYAGMKMAAQKLHKEGISVSIYPYDVKSDANGFKNAEKKKGFTDINLMVGPLYPATNNLAQAFNQKHEVIQIHPTSNNLSLLTAENTSFLMQPSYELQAQKSLDYMLKEGKPKSVSIYFGDAKKDSTFASIYASEAKKKGFKVIELNRFTNQKPKVEKGHIFYAGDNNSGSRFLQNLAFNDITNDVIITANSFNWDKINTSQFLENVNILYPEFVNSEKESVIEFDKEYFANNYALASYYSYLGYDLVNYFANALKSGKNMFKLNLEYGQYLDGFLLSGYDFSGKLKQNQIVPIVKYNNGIFEEIYR